MNRILKKFCWLAVLAAATAGAQSPVAITLDTRAAGAAIPGDFIGLSFEMERVLPDANGGYFFSPTNKTLIALFQTLGVKSLRVGGNTADRPTVKIPGPADADSLFAFAKAADVKVIYTLRLREGNRTNAAALAKHIFQRYQPQLACFAIGNEPNVFAREYPVYRDEWKRYADAITARDCAPGAKFCGPSATPGRTAWARDFANEFGRSGLIAFISQHDYPGGAGNRATNVVAARDQMLSANWLDHYRRFHDSFVPAARSNGVSYRLEEANNFFNGGAKDVSDTFAAALWGLDYLHWWAAHGARGINFHTGDQVAAGERMNACRYATFWSTPNGYDVHPIGYGIKAFDLGSHGRSLPITDSNPEKVNLTAYATLGTSSDGTSASRRCVWVTIINKEHAAVSHEVEVKITANENFSQASALFMTAPGNDVSTKAGVMLGGAAIKEDASWDGKWSPVTVSNDRKTVPLKLAPASAAVVKLLLD